MRYADLTLHPGRDGFHPADRAIVDASSIERVAIRQFSRIEDGTVILLYQLRGEPGPARSVLDAEPDILTHDLSTAGTELHAYVHMEPNETIDVLTQLPQWHHLVVETPVECLPNGGLRAGVVGDTDTFSAAIETIPEEVGLELESIRAYDPDSRRPEAVLTDRQQEVLRAAIDAGYYAVPRRATHADIADELDVAPVTVGEHLRKIESRLLTRLVRGFDDQ